MTDPVGHVLALFERHGGAAYLGESVSQLEHALQAAALAESEAAPSALIAAVLLHDVGHLLDAEADDPAVLGRDLAHEATAVRWLRQHFGDGVVRPVELHVAAKRYLCAAEPAYAAGLSSASVASLRLQGGPMSAEEAEAFRRDPYGADAVRLRRWDDAAKVAGRATPPAEHFRRYLEAARRA